MNARPQAGRVDVYFAPSSSNREYTLRFSDDMTTWSNVPGQVRIRGNGSGQGMLPSTNAPTSRRYYRIDVRLP